MEWHGSNIPIWLRLAYGLCPLCGHKIDADEESIYCPICEWRPTELSDDPDHDVPRAEV